MVNLFAIQFGFKMFDKTNHFFDTNHNIVLIFSIGTIDFLNMDCFLFLARRFRRLAQMRFRGKIMKNNIVYSYFIRAFAAIFFASFVVRVLGILLEEMITVEHSVKKVFHSVVKLKNTNTLTL